MKRQTRDILLLALKRAHSTPHAGKALRRWLSAEALFTWFTAPRR